MNTVNTKYGVISGATNIATGINGNLESLFVNKKQEILTSAGSLTPQFYTEDMGRRRATPIHFHCTGNIKSLPIQKAAEVATPIGEILAEYITFYDTGELRKVFPLNGRLSGYWTEKDEFKMADPVEFKTSIGDFTSKPININFYKSGSLRSVTLWPGETVDLESIYGKATAKIGVSFYESGELKSFEPSEPYVIETPVGKLTAFDTDPEGITGDSNSLQFHKDGYIKAMLTVNDVIKVKTADDVVHEFSPTLKSSYCSDLVKIAVPLLIEFNNGKVRFNNNKHNEFDVSHCIFKTEPFSKYKTKAVKYEC